MSALTPHFGIMKATAVQDYDTVKRFCDANGLIIVEPKGKSWQKIEDATAEMLSPLFSETQFPYYLNRGYSYYKTLTP